MEDLQKIILALLGIAIILFFIINFIPFLDESGSRTACKNWVNMQSRTTVAGVKLPGLFESPCLTFSSKIEDDTKDKIYKHLADSMYDCWSMYGAGKLDFFSDFDWGSSDTHCLVCEEINVDKEINVPIGLDEFEEYLSNHNPPSHGETYAEYFLGAANSKINFGNQGTLEIKESMPIYAIFVVNKKSVGAEEGIIGFYKSIWSASSKLGLLMVGAELSIPGAPRATATLLRSGSKAGPWVAAGVIVTGITAFTLADGSQLFPSLFLVNGNEIIDGCDTTYYKPKGSSNTEINKIGKN